jgi:predicted dithiol-disulfide oxidoreductase (DUF899 family)
MDWHFPRVSSDNNASNDDFRVSFKPDEMAAGTAFCNFRRTNPGLEDLSGDSVYKDAAGEIFHTDSTFGAAGNSFQGSTATWM